MQIPQAKEPHASEVLKDSWGMMEDEAGETGRGQVTPCLMCSFLRQWAPSKC